MADLRVPASSEGYRALLDSFYAAEVRYIAEGGAAAGADFSDMASHFHADVVVHQGPTVPYGGDWRGIDGVERFFAAHSETWQTLDLSDIRYFEGDTGVAVTLRMRAIARRTGRSVDTRTAGLLTFEDGLIRDFRVFYFDPVQVRDATWVREG
jgi:ketosteroid isomerase-like protein